MVVISLIREIYIIIILYHIYKLIYNNVPKIKLAVLSVVKYSSAKGEINVPIALSAFRDKKVFFKQHL